MNTNDLKPIKSLGQHWLNDEGSLETILNSIEFSSEDTVLEVGPGLGSLTSKLVNKAGEVIAVELDSEVVEELLKQVSDKKLKVIAGDILKFDLTKLPKNYKLVANIPYYLTSKLLRVLNESLNPFSEAALLVQKEVAQRVTAKPGGMSLLSVSVQYYCEVRLGEVITADKFTPPPKVDSQILLLKTRQEPLFKEVDTKQFFRIVRAGFGQRRKTLLNSLSGGLKLERDQADELIKLAGISPQTRPQELRLQDWHELYKVLV